MFRKPRSSGKDGSAKNKPTKLWRQAQRESSPSFSVLFLIISVVLNISLVGALSTFDSVFEGIDLDHARPGKCYTSVDEDDFSSRSVRVESIRLYRGSSYVKVWYEIPGVSGNPTTLSYSSFKDIYAKEDVGCVQYKAEERNLRSCD